MNCVAKSITTLCFGTARHSFTIIFLWEYDIFRGNYNLLIINIFIFNQKKSRRTGIYLFGERGVEVARTNQAVGDPIQDRDTNVPLSVGA